MFGEHRRQGAVISKGGTTATTAYHGDRRSGQRLALLQVVGCRKGVLQRHRSKLTAPQLRPQQRWSHRVKAYLGQKGVY